MSEKKPRILYVVKHFSGGIFTYLIQLTSRLIEDYDIMIGYSVTPETPQNFRQMFDPRVQLMRIVAFEGEMNMFKEMSAESELKELVESYKPDIIHLHGYNAGMVGRKALDGMGIPMFYTPHGYLHLYDNHNRLTKSRFRSTEKSCAAADCTTIACSKGEFAETLSFTDRAMYINNGIDTKAIDKAIKDQVINEHPLTVYTTGLINYQKNPVMFNEIAMAMPDVKFVWIGDGDLRWKLTAPNIEVTGWLDRDDAVRRANQADVFILTSLWEGLPMSLLEAMYLENFAVVSNVVGNRDVISNGETGFICDTAAAFVNAINHWDKEDTKEIQAAAKAEILENYTVENMAEKYSKAYRVALHHN